MIRIVYNCKICDRVGTAYADQSCPPDHIDILAKCLCCDYCFQARIKREKAEKAIFRACHFLIHADSMKNPDKIREKAHQVIGEATRMFAEAVCAAKRITVVYSEEFADQLIRTPDKAGAALAFYKRTVESVA